MIEDKLWPNPGTGEEPVTHPIPSLEEVATLMEPPEDPHLGELIRDNIQDNDRALELVAEERRMADTANDMLKRRIQQLEQDLTQSNKAIAALHAQAEAIGKHPTMTSEQMAVYWLQNMSATTSVNVMKTAVKWRLQVIKDLFQTPTPGTLP